MIDPIYPKQIDKYKIESVLGQGAMGIVYKSYDSQIDRFVAIKVLHHHLLDGEMGTELEQRFGHEVKAAAKCLHPNIVTIFDCGIYNGSPYMVMEYVRGIDLKLMLSSNHHFNIIQATGIVIKILDALSAAHQLGIVHRDIKPANILILDNGVVKVTDFGVARIDSSDLTQIGDVIGTPSYMSPEANRGDFVDNRSDLYSTALVLLELLTHKKILRNEDNEESIVKHINDLSISEQQKNNFSQVLIKALHSNPEHRYQCAIDFSKALSKCQNLSVDQYEQNEDMSETVVKLRTSHLEGLFNHNESSQMSVLQSLNKDELSAVEKSLTKYVGPIAKVLLKKQAKQAVNINQLLDSLATSISSVQDRKEFISQIHSSGVFKSHDSLSEICNNEKSNRNQSRKQELDLDENELAQLTTWLSPYLGPIAKHLIKKSLKNVSEKEQLHLLLAEKIPDNAHRNAFLKQCNSSV